MQEITTGVAEKSEDAIGLEFTFLFAMNQNAEHLASSDLTVFVKSQVVTPSLTFRVYTPYYCYQPPRPMMS